MSARNGPETFGWITRLLHWSMALAIFAMLAFGSILSGMEPSLSNLWMYGAHKSFGLTLLALALLRLIWHRISPPPHAMDQGEPEWQLALARWVRFAFYVLLLAVPVTGWIASAASGLDTVLFETWTLPRIAPVSERWEEGFFAAHRMLTKLLIVTILLHLAGALRRALKPGDRTLARMWRG